MPVERPAGDELAHRALPTVGGLHVVEHRATVPAVVEADPSCRVDRFGADMESENNLVFFQGRPDGLPLLALPRRTIDGRTNGEESKLEAEGCRSLDLSDRVVHVEQGERGGQHEARRLALEVNEEGVRDPAALSNDLGSSDVERPD